MSNKVIISPPKNYTREIEVLMDKTISELQNLTATLYDDFSAELFEKIKEYKQYKFSNVIGENAYILKTKEITKLKEQFLERFLKVKDIQNKEEVLLNKSIEALNMQLEICVNSNWEKDLSSLKNQVLNISKSNYSRFDTKKNEFAKIKNIATKFVKDVTIVNNLSAGNITKSEFNLPQNISNEKSKIIAKISNLMIKLQKNEKVNESLPVRILESKLDSLEKEFLNFENIKNKTYLLEKISISLIPSKNKLLLKRKIEKERIISEDVMRSTLKEIRDISYMQEIIEDFKNEGYTIEEIAESSQIKATHNKSGHVLFNYGKNGIGATSLSESCSLLKKVVKSKNGECLEKGTKELKDEILKSISLDKKHEEDKDVGLKKYMK